MVVVRMLVSASDMLVEVDARFGRRNCRGLGTGASCLVALAVERLVGVFSSETW